MKWGFPSGASSKEPACQCRGRDLRDTVSIPGWEDPLEEGMTTHSSILAWRTPWTEEPRGHSPWGHKELDTAERQNSSHTVSHSLLDLRSGHSSSRCQPILPQCLSTGPLAQKSLTKNSMGWLDCSILWVTWEVWEVEFVAVQSLIHIPLFCSPMDCSPPGSSVHGISQARIQEWVAVSFSRRSSWPRGQTCISCIGRQISVQLSHQGSPDVGFGGKQITGMKRFWKHQ